MAVQRSGPGFAALEAALESLDGIEAKSGWFETAKYKTGMPVATIAYINEFGALTGRAQIAGILQGGESKGHRAVYIPPRPFMRPTVAAKGAEWMALLERGAAVVLTGGMTAHDVMEQVALKAAADVAKTITEVMEPPNAPSTIKRKGFNKPLVHTRQMFQSVTGIVEKPA
jgi:hypothetical protein